jgi:hypothetical protein
VSCCEHSNEHLGVKNAGSFWLAEEIADPEEGL